MKTLSIIAIVIAGLVSACSSSDQVPGNQQTAELAVLTAQAPPAHAARQQPFLSGPCCTP